MKKISVIVPCYNESASLPLFYDEINRVSKLMKYDFEFIFVNDGSRDNTIEVIKSFTEDKRVKFIDFSRNFGKESAMYAGLSYSSGDYVVIIDADLQHPPELLIEMADALENGYDVANARRKDRKGEPALRSFFSNKFYKLINKISKTEMVNGAYDYALMKRKVVDAILSMKEYNRYTKGIFGFVGFKVKWIEANANDRVAGVTSWSFTKLLSYAIEGIIAFSTAPLVIPTVLSIMFGFISFILLVIIIVKAILGSVIGVVLALSCILFFMSSMILLSIGIIGQYLAKTYLEVKDRPIYIVNETNIK